MPYDYKVPTRSSPARRASNGATRSTSTSSERVALQRSTTIRYPVQGAKDKDLFGRDAAGSDGPDAHAGIGTSGDGEPVWTDEQLAELEQRKLAFIDQIQGLGHDKRLFSSVAAGDPLAEHVLGPHSLASFATEWRAYPMTTWGATAKGPTTVRAEELTPRRWRGSRATAGWSAPTPS